MIRTKEQWEEIYQEGRTPWDARSPEPRLVALIERGVIKPCATIDLGCGTGNEAIFLANRGFTVTGVDISEEAIREARRRAEEAGIERNFIASNVLEMPLMGKFDFAIDRACFHFLDPEDHPKYLEKLNSILNPGAIFFLVISSDYETAKGPHQFSKQDIREIFGRDFDIKSVELVTLETHGEKPRPYICLMRKK